MTVVTYLDRLEVELRQATRVIGFNLIGRGQWRELERYCLQDVQITRDLYEFAKRRGFLCYVPRGKRRRVRFQVTL